MEAEIPVVWVVMDNAAFGTIAGLEKNHYGWSFGCLFESEGKPYTSLIAYALTPDVKGLIFITPKSTGKFKNILKNKHVSLLVDTRTNTSKDYMGAESVRILGNAHRVRRGKNWTRLSGIFAKKHARLKKIITSPETALILVEITDCIHVTKFQSVSIWKAP